MVEFIPAANRHILDSFFDAATFQGIDVRRERQGVLYEAVLLNSAFERYSDTRQQQQAIAHRILLADKAVPSAKGIDDLLTQENALLRLLQGRDLYGFLVNGILLGVGGAYPATPPHTFCKVAESPKALELRASRWVHVLCDLSLEREAEFLAVRPAIPVFEEYLDIALGRESIKRDPLVFLQCMRSVVEQLNICLPRVIN